MKGRQRRTLSPTSTRQGMTEARAKAEGKPDPAKRTEPREVKETAERECHTSRLGDNGRQMNPSTQRGIQAGDK